MSNHYYVYAHVNEDEIVYIGKGKYSRAWQSERRSKDHYEFMINNLPYLHVEILINNILEEEALSIEKYLIKKYQPKFNVYYTDKFGQVQKEKWSKLSLEEKQKICNIGGESTWKEIVTPEGLFKNVQEAADYYKIPYTTAKTRAQRNYHGWSYSVT